MRIRAKLFGTSVTREEMILERINQVEGMDWLSVPRFTSWAMILVSVVGFLAGIIVGL
jgi:hypothetical protein